MSDSIGSLCDSFDIDRTEKTVSETTKEITEIKNNLNEQKYNIEDKEYIRTELQNLIELNTTVLEQLADQLKLGSVPRLYEVYSTLSNSISENLMD